MLQSRNGPTYKEEARWPTRGVLKSLVRSPFLFVCLFVLEGGSS